MSHTAAIWLFRVLGAIAGVAVTAVAGVHADAAHFGMWFPLAAAAQIALLTLLGKWAKTWSA